MKVDVLNRLPIDRTSVLAPTTQRTWHGSIRNGAYQCLGSTGTSTWLQSYQVFLEALTTPRQPLAGIGCEDIHIFGSILPVSGEHTGASASCTIELSKWFTIHSPTFWAYREWGSPLTSAFADEMSPETPGESEFYTLNEMTGLGECGLLNEPLTVSAELRLLESWRRSVELEDIEAKGRILEISYLGTPVLRQRSAPVASIDGGVRQLVSDLFKTMRWNKGVGLAANQVGIARRVAVVDVGSEGTGPLVLINPTIVHSSEDTETVEEGCLSIPDIFADVDRPFTVVVDALDLDGLPYRHQAVGYEARAIQHEIDHLDGVLFLDHLSAVKRGIMLAKWKKSGKGKQTRTGEPTSQAR